MFKFISNQLLFFKTDYVNFRTDFYGVLLRLNIFYLFAMIDENNFDVKGLFSIIMCHESNIIFYDNTIFYM